MVSGRGKVYIYDGKSYDQIATLDFQGGADNLRYDTATKRVYVVCGSDQKTRAIAMIDAISNERLREENGATEAEIVEALGVAISVNAGAALVLFRAGPGCVSRENAAEFRSLTLVLAQGHYPEDPKTLGRRSKTRRQD